MTPAVTEERFRSARRSPLPGISAEKWARFVAVMEVCALGETSESGGLGLYDMRPRRLVELGYATSIEVHRTKKGRQIYTCHFVEPWSHTRFLKDSLAQYVAFSKSMKKYAEAIALGSLRAPEGESLSGVLAILHRGGRGALEAWPNLFPQTLALYQKAKGIF